MKVSLQWLRTLAPELTGTPEEIAERLSQLGYPVEEIRDLAAGLQQIVVGHVISVRQHPNADRLRVCEVDGGSGTLQIVCGAPNVEAGGWYPLAPVGATLPGGMTIGKAKLRGEVSEGMLCSEKELGLGEGAAGLMVLSGLVDGPVEALTPGASFLDLLGGSDTLLDVEVTSNRPDLLSHRGVVRELTDGGEGSLQLPAFPGEDPAIAKWIEETEVRSAPDEIAAGGIRIRIESPELCSRYLGVVMRGVRVGPSPAWLRGRLRAIGLRSINNVVDATNYILMELGQPLHAFDLGKLAGGSIVVRRAGEGETIRTLDGVDRRLSPTMLAICDAEVPVAVAGVMGGEGSEVSEETTDLLLECALFTPGPIRATRKALGISTDSSYRFERGVDPEGMERALFRAARLIAATAGGKLEGPVLSVTPRPFARERVILRPERVGKLLGIPFTSSEISALLAPLGFGVEEGEGGLTVEVPGFRSYDVTREVDLIEEVARRHGFDNFPAELGGFRPGTMVDDPLFVLSGKIRAHLASRGLFEAQTPAFAPAGEGTVELQNPLSAEEGFLRGALLPGLIRRVEYNAAHGNRDIRLFEIGTVFDLRGAADGRHGSGEDRSGADDSRRGSGDLPFEETRLSFILHGRRTPPHWSGPDTPLDLWDLRGLVEGLLGLPIEAGWTLEPFDGVVPEGTPASKGWSVALSRFELNLAFALKNAAGEFVGVVGPLRSGSADLPPWAGTVWAGEIALPASPAPVSTRTYRPIPTHPGAERDLALLLPAGVTSGALLAVARRVGGGILREAGVFDVYRDRSMEAGVRSVAIRLRFQAEERTLKDQEVEEIVQEILGAFQEELHVGFRGQKD